MREVMAGMMGMEPDPPMPGEPVMLVATTRDSFMGASVIQYPGFMEQAAEQVGGDFFVLPSSIHEVLIIPDDGHQDYHELEAMVQSINQAEVAPADRLSDHVYHYDQTDRVFELAEKTAGRKLEQKLEKKAEQRDPAEKRQWSMHRKQKHRGEPFPKQYCKNQYRYENQGAFNAYYKKRRTFPFLMRRKGRRIRRKMRQCKMDSVAGYLRKMAIDGYVINLDTSDIKEVVRSLSGSPGFGSAILPGECLVFVIEKKGKQHLNCTFLIILKGKGG